MKAPPAYLGDCMAGLMETENIDRVEACLNASPNLIRKNKSMAIEVEYALKITKIASTAGHSFGYVLHSC